MKMHKRDMLEWWTAILPLWKRAMKVDERLFYLYWLKDLEFD